MLSSIWRGVLVAGTAQVTTGFATIHFRKNCDQNLQSIYAAQSGKALLL